MGSLTKDQVRHEIINLRKSVGMLQRSVSGENWKEFTSTSRTTKWLKAQTVIGGIQHCKSSLSKIPPSAYDEAYNFGPGQNSISGQQFQDEIRQTLSDMERVMAEVNQELKPHARRPDPILPRIPRPSVTKSVHVVPPSSEPELIDEKSLVEEEHARPDPTNLLLESDQYESAPADHRLTVDFDKVPHVPKIQSTPAFLETSTAVQDDLAEQLAKMAEQLKRNAMHFSEALEKDKGVLEGMDEKLDRNHDVLSKERVRLRDHRGKSWGTTWITILSLIVVTIGFFLTYFVIRVT